MKRLNFGCGDIIKPKSEGWINVDIQDHKDVDKSFDFSEYPYPLEDNSFDYVLLDNVLEHLEYPHKVMKELWRICKPNAIIKIIVPYYNTYYAYADITHKNFFNELAFVHLLEGNTYDLNHKSYFEIVSLKKIPQRFFKIIPMPILDVLKRFLSNIIVTLDVTTKAIKEGEQ